MRTTTKDVEIEGYKIPADTVIIAQISSVMYDEKARNFEEKNSMSSF